MIVGDDCEYFLHPCLLTLVLFQKAELKFVVFICN